MSILLLLIVGTGTKAEARPAHRAKPAAEQELSGNTNAPVFDATAEPDVGHARDPQLLNPVEMLSLVREYATEIARAMVTGELQREEAVRLMDAIKLACIQDRLSGMKLMKKLSDDSLAATGRPEIRADELHLRHEFRAVEMAHQRVLELQKELIECVGESLEVGGTGNGTQGPAAPNGSIDPAGTSVEIPPAERPSAASTYK